MTMLREGSALSARKVMDSSSLEINEEELCGDCSAEKMGFSAC